MENRDITKNNATTVNKMIAKSPKRKKLMVKRSTLRNYIYVAQR